MFNFSIIIFVIGWALWFFIDKHPASLGIILPVEQAALLDNFQLAFDLLTGGYLRASFVFAWKAHYIVLSIITALLLSALHASLSRVYHRRRLRQLMWPNRSSADDPEDKKADS